MEWEKDSVMWNWVRVTIWPSFAAPTPTIRCQFSSSIIPPPLLRLLLLPQLPVTVHRNPISHQPRHPRLWLVILLYDFNDPLSTHFPLLYVHPTFTFYTDQYQYYHLLYYFPTPPTSAATTTTTTTPRHPLLQLQMPSPVLFVRQLLFPNYNIVTLSPTPRHLHPQLPLQQYQFLIPPSLLLSSSPTTTNNRLWLLLTSLVTYYIYHNYTSFYHQLPTLL